MLGKFVNTAVNPDMYIEKLYKNHLDTSANKMKRLKWKKAARDFFEGYITTSSLHGFKNIADPSPWKSTLWICIMIASIVFCAIFIKVQMTKFQGSVLTTTISSTADPVWAIPFPAVTICNNIVVTKSGANAIKSMLERYEIENTRVYDYLSKLSLILSQNLQLDNDVENYGNISSILKGIGYNTDRIMYEAALPCEKQFKYCEWKMNIENCSNLFYMIKTSRGYCCSFNAYGAATYEHRYKGNTSKVVHFSGSAGKNTGLIVLMDVVREENFSSISPAHGFEVYIHDGQDYPDFSLFAKTLPVSTSQTISLTPSMIDSYSAVRAIRPHDRGCRFEDEFKLGWSSLYNFQTCLHECKADLIYELCRCVPYYYPNTGFLKSCGLEDIACLNKNQKKFHNLVMNSDDNDKVTDELIRKHLGEVKVCDCLPDCNDVRYDMSLNMATSEKLLDENTSILRVHYSTISCIRYSKNVYYTWDMFVASIGGIFGLCLGGSIISVIELFYYIITYFSCSKANKKQKGESIQKFRGTSKKTDAIKVLYPVFEYTP